MNRMLFILALVGATGLLGLAMPATAVSPDCLVHAATDTALGTFGKLVYENLVWPRDFASHISYYFGVYVPRFVGEFEGCL